MCSVCWDFMNYLFKQCSSQKTLADHMHTLNVSFSAEILPVSNVMFQHTSMVAASVNDHICVGRMIGPHCSQQVLMDILM